MTPEPLKEPSDKGDQIKRCEHCRFFAHDSDPRLFAGDIGYDYCIRDFDFCNDPDFLTMVCSLFKRDKPPTRETVGVKKIYENIEFYSNFTPAERDSAIGQLQRDILAGKYNK